MDLIHRCAVPLPRARGRLLEAEGVAGQCHGAEVADIIEDVGGLASGGAEDVEEGRKWSGVGTA